MKILAGPTKHALSFLFVLLFGFFLKKAVVREYVVSRKVHVNIAWVNNQMRA